MKKRTKNINSTIGIIEIWSPPVVSRRYFHEVLVLGLQLQCFFYHGLGVGPLILWSVSVFETLSLESRPAK